MIVGLFLIFFQIVIGGITRLTGSGLSITKWEVVTGTIPPLNEEHWKDAFDLYKETPQYLKINAGMSISQFKFIYFWEYLHRLWARSMGMVFIFPFLIFWYRGYLSNRLLRRRLIVVFFLAGLVGLFGWIMVASGLNDRPWVSAYKLSIHLSLALVVLGYLHWTYLNYFVNKITATGGRGRTKSLLISFLVLICLQIVLGGLMSGLKASLIYPTWPTFKGSWIIPGELLNKQYWKWSSVVDYELTPLMPALVQFLHRSLGYVIFVVGLYITFRFYKLGIPRRGYLLMGLLFTQVVIGIAVLLNSVGSVPIFFGVMHQAVAILILLCVLYNVYRGFPDKVMI